MSYHLINVMIRMSNQVSDSIVIDGFWPIISANL